MNEDVGSPVSLKKWIILIILIWLVLATNSLRNPLIGVTDFFVNPGTIMSLIISAPILLLIIPAKNQAKQFKKTTWLKWGLISIACSIFLLLFLLSKDIFGSLINIFFIFRNSAYLILFAPAIFVTLMLPILYFWTRTKKGKIFSTILVYCLVTFFFLQASFLMLLFFIYQ